jgi:hypothetical protein
MGKVKDEQMRKEENWKAVCQKNGWVCEICGSYPTDPEKPYGYEGGLCPDHRNPKD